jgi:multidrug efflux pump subunit AcrA (membrane-fusion protein)
MRWLIVVGIVVVVVGVCVAGVMLGTRAAKNKPTQITVATAESADFTREVSGTGNVEAKVYSLSFSQPGRVARILVAEGDPVRKGMVLAELDVVKIGEDLVATREQQTARAVQIRALTSKLGVESRRINGSLTDARKQLDLTRKLQAAGGASKDEVTAQERQVSDLEGQLATLRSETDSQRKGLEAQQTQGQATIRGYEQALRESRLTSPVAGTVSTIDFRVGEAAQGALKVVDVDTLRVKAQLAELDSVDITPGMTARIEVDALPDRPFEAKVEEIGVVATVKGEGGSATVPIKFRFTETAARTMVKTGYTLTARVTTKRLPQVVQAPLECLVEETKDGVKTTSVWIVTQSVSTPRSVGMGRVRIYMGSTKMPATVAKKTVTVLARNMTKAAVEGIEPGAIVVSLPPDSLKDAMRVQYDLLKKDEATK